MIDEYVDIVYSPFKLMVYAIPHMRHVLHARPKTTPAVRREIQNSQESLINIAAHYGGEPKN
jgi:hypothetical protein